MKSLYEINIDLQQIMQEVEEEAIKNGGEITEALSDKLGGLQQDRDIKIGNICRFIKSLNSESEMVAAEAKKLSKRASVAKNKADSLKAYLSVIIPKGEKFSDENSKISWRKSKVLVITKNAEIPKDYQVTAITADKAGLKKAVEAGEDFKGIGIVINDNIQIK